MKRFNKIAVGVYTLLTLGVIIYSLTYQRHNYQLIFMSGAVFGAFIIYSLICITSKIEEKRLNG